MHDVEKALNVLRQANTRLRRGVPEDMPEGVSELLEQLTLAVDVVLARWRLSVLQHGLPCAASGAPMIGPADSASAPGPPDLPECGQPLALVPSSVRAFLPGRMLLPPDL
jgi:hypothetical protein